MVLVYGQTPATWVQAQFAFTESDSTSQASVWGALLDVAPQSRPLAPLRSPNLLTLDCRQGLDAGKLARFVELLRQNGDRMPEVLEVTAPYPGLRPFEQHEAEIFFGREHHVDRLLEIRRGRDFSPSLGRLGAANPVSCALAFLAPRLGGSAPERLAHTNAPVGPSPAPAGYRLARVDSLGRTTPSGDNDSDQLETTPALIEAELRRGPLGLVHLVDDIRVRTASPTNFNLLVLVDQFEEIFRYSERGVAQGDEADAFVNLLLASYRAAEASIYVVITMRTDFGNCTRFLELPDAINHAQYLTPRLSRDQLEQAITGPGRVFGVMLHLRSSMR